MQKFRDMSQQEFSGKKFEFAGRTAFIRGSADDVRGAFQNMVKLGGQFSNEDIMLQQACNNHIYVSGKIIGSEEFVDDTSLTWMHLLDYLNPKFENQRRHLNIPEHVSYER